MYDWDKICSIKIFIVLIDTQQQDSLVEIQCTFYKTPGKTQPIMIPLIY